MRSQGIVRRERGRRLIKGRGGGSRRETALRTSSGRSQLSDCPLNGAARDSERCERDVEARGTRRGGWARTMLSLSLWLAVTDTLGLSAIFSVPTRRLHDLPHSRAALSPSSVLAGIAVQRRHPRAHRRLSNVHRWLAFSTPCKTFRPNLSAQLFSRFVRV
ncbi:hypothetical protein OF846_002920 [Rhodotorula toruloides]|nr:hypothetical protein OF846_002920 [Rhodotorula toruloides]